MCVLRLQHELLLCSRGWRNLRRLTGVVLSLGCLFLVGGLFPQAVVADADEQMDHNMRYEQKVQELHDKMAKSIDPESWKRYDACRKCVTRKPGYWKYEACFSKEGDRLRVGKAKCNRYSMWGNDNDSMLSHCRAQGYERVDWQRLKEGDNGYLVCGTDNGGDISMTPTDKRQVPTRRNRAETGRCRR